MSQRAVEMGEEADILSISQFQLAPAILQGQTKEKMESMMSVLQDLIGRLTSLRMQHLFMILASPRSGCPLDVELFWFGGLHLAVLRAWLPVFLGDCAVSGQIQAFAYTAYVPSPWSRALSSRAACIPLFLFN